MSYLRWQQITLPHLDNTSIETHYDRGFVFGRIDRGVMDETRSLRIDLSSFSLSSENRRILRKAHEITLSVHLLPYAAYHWHIGKLAKDFYDTKFGVGTFSANKVKELLTDQDKSNFNRLYEYHRGNQSIGYAICLETEQMVHYSYPFYDLSSNAYPFNPNTGMGMMLLAIEQAHEHGKQYFYLGSAQRPGDTYKLQFAELEWWTGEYWSRDTEELKRILPSF